MGLRSIGENYTIESNSKDQWKTITLLCGRPGEKIIESMSFKRMVITIYQLCCQKTRSMEDVFDRVTQSMRRDSGAIKLHLALL